MTDKQNANLLFANFNQDFTCISVGTKKGYSIINCDPFGRVFTKNDGAKGIVEMLFCTSLIALVGAADQPSSSPRKLQIVNTKRQSMICELLFPSSILSVKLNRKTLVIVLEVEIYVYDISNMKLLQVIETSKNPDAIVALSPSSEPSYLAYPTPIPSSTSALSTSPSSQHASPSSPEPQSGDVIIFDTRTLSQANVVQAHKTPIAFLSISSNGSMLATSSSKGTVIRVFSLPNAEKLYQFRRGMQGARIHSMTFNTVGSLLAVSSATDTVHIFKLGGKAKGDSGSSSRNAPTSPSAASIDSQNGSGGLEGGYEAFIDGKKKSGVSQSLKRRSMHLTRNLAGSIGGFLPNTVTEMWEPSRDFAYLKLPSSGTKCIVALSGTMPHVMVISSEGYFYSYNIDLDNGGECSLMKQYSLLDSTDESTVPE